MKMSHKEVYPEMPEYEKKGLPKQPFPYLVNIPLSFYHFANIQTRKLAVRLR